MVQTGERLSVSASYLLQRGKRWYFRFHIPLDLRSHFGERRELKKSLKTTRYDAAVSGLRCCLYRTERLFTLMRSGLMTNAEIKKLVDGYFNAKTLADFRTDAAADAEDARADGIVVDGEGLSLHLLDLEEAFGEGEHVRVAASVADSILECAGLPPLDKGGHQYRVLCREALKGIIAGTRLQLEGMQGGDGVPSAAVPPTPSPPAKVKGGTPAESVKLSEALAEYVKEHAASGRWREKTREESEGVYRLLVGIVGDRDVSELDYKMLSNFRDSLTRFPSNHTKRRAYRGKSIPEILRMKVGTPLSPSSVNKHIIRTGAFLKWAVKRGYVAANFAEGLTIVRAGKESEERDAYSTEDLLKLVRSPLANFRKIRPERFWVPLLGLYTGARLNEICQLHLEDAKEADGILFIDINSRGERTLKNEASRRAIPVHPVLIDLGFKKYVDVMRKKGEKRLWPGLRLKRGGFGDDFGKWYQRWNRKHVTTEKKKVFHSLRANFVTSLLNAKVDPAVVSALVGHVGGSMTLDRYHKGFSVAVLREAVEKLSYEEIEEELLKLKKLPL